MKMPYAPLPSGPVSQSWCPKVPNFTSRDTIRTFQNGQKTWLGKGKRLWFQECNRGTGGVLGAERAKHRVDDAFPVETGAGVHHIR